MHKELVHIFWHCADDDGNFNFYEEEDEDYVIDLSTGKIYTPSEDIGELDEPYFFKTSAGTNFMFELMNDVCSFLHDELTGKWLADAIKKEITEPLLPKGILRMKPWVKPHHGELTLVYHIDSFQCNHPLDPEEWDMEINCLGALGLNYELKEMENEKQST
jgi:hypothetical protein